jgi:NADPH:quinone reductase-like Zn-dependent oxidoreductase
MKAIVMHRLGGPEVLQLEDVPTPRPAGDEVLLRVGAVSVNNLDLRLRTGDYHRVPKMPHVLGWDPAGTVDEVGSAVTQVRVGDRVVSKGKIRCGHCPECVAGRPCSKPEQLGLERWGAYAEYVCLPEANLRVIPDALSFVQASPIYRHFPQAFSLLEDTASVEHGEWLMVVGAAGALGSCLVQVGKLLGARVIAAAGSQERADACLAFGADAAVNYRAGDVNQQVREITRGHGVDVVTDNIGDPSIWSSGFDSLASGGRLVTVGAHGGGVVPLDVNQLYMKQLRVIGTAGSGPRHVKKAEEEASKGTIRAVIGNEFPLAEAADAHRAAESRAVVGKVMLIP